MIEATPSNSCQVLTSTIQYYNLGMALRIGFLRKPWMVGINPTLGLCLNVVDLVAFLLTFIDYPVTIG